METAVAKNFHNAFNPADEKHCVWFKLFADLMAQPEDDMKEHGSKIIRVMKANPMGQAFDPANMLDLVFIQFTLALKHSRAVLDGEGWMPPSPSTRPE